MVVMVTHVCGCVERIFHFYQDSPCSLTGCHCWQRAHCATTLHPKHNKRVTHPVRPWLLSAATCRHETGYQNKRQWWAVVIVIVLIFCRSQEYKCFTSFSRGASDSLGDFLNMPLKTLPFSWYIKKTTELTAKSFSLFELLFALWEWFS